MKLKRGNNTSQEYVTEEEFVALVKKKNIPLLILDEKWLDLFPPYRQTPKMKALVKELTGLLKKQGGLADDLKGLKRYKTQMMQEIVENMGPDDSAIGKLKRKKLEKNQKVLLSLRDEVAEKEDVLAGIPYQIRELNARLLYESTMTSYDYLKAGQERLNELNGELNTLRERQRLLMLEKQDLENKNDKIYSYLHTLVGAKLMEDLDGGKR